MLAASRWSSSAALTLRRAPPVRSAWRSSATIILASSATSRGCWRSTRSTSRILRQTSPARRCLVTRCSTPARACAYRRASPSIACAVSSRRWQASSWWIWRWPTNSPANITARMRASPGGRLALRAPAGQGGRLPDPRRHLHLVELVVLVDVEVARLLVLGRAWGDRTQRRAAEESHLDVLREAMEVQEPALALDAIEG